MNQRRRLVIVFGAGVLGAPLPNFAQPAKKPAVVGVLGTQDLLSAQTLVAAFKQELQKLGYIEGKNLTLQLRFADGKFDRIPGHASELVNLKVDVVVSVGSVTTRALQQATSTIPIVMATAPDPVGAGLVKSLARPGGNVTGLSNLAVDIGTKHLEMLLMAVPKPARVAFLYNPANPSNFMVLKAIQSAAQKAGATILPVEASTAPEIEKAFSAMTQAKAGALIVARDGLLIRQERQIAELALKNRLPSISETAEYAEAGGLMTYGVNLADQFRRLATYVDKILNGAKPGDLPVEQAMKFEMVVNGKTAKTLGLALPQSILISVDKVLE